MALSSPAQTWRLRSPFCGTMFDSKKRLVHLAGAARKVGGGRHVAPVKTAFAVVVQLGARAGGASRGSGAKLSLRASWPVRSRPRRYSAE